MCKTDWWFDPEDDEQFDAFYDTVVGPSRDLDTPPRYSYAELRARGTWWQRMKKRLRRAAPTGEAS